jgi:hypothetical protein
MSEPEWSLPYSRAELIARVEALEAGLGEVYRMVHYHRAQWADVDGALERLTRATAETGDESMRCAPQPWRQAEELPDEKPGLICPKCGVDRYKATCPNNFLGCPMHGTTSDRGVAK